MSWPLMTGDSFTGAIEWNVGRTWRVRFANGPVVPTALQARVLTALLGAWAASEQGRWCYPIRGRHRDRCHHSLNLIPVRVGLLSEWLFGTAGGSQARQVRAAIEALANISISYKGYGPEGRAYIYGPLITLSPMTEDLSYWFWEEEIARTPDYIIRLAPDLLASLMDGHFQRIPNDLVQGLSGADFLLWMTALCQVPVGRLGRGVQEVTLSLTGRRPAIEAWRCGWGRLSHGRLLAAVDRAVGRGNELRTPFHLQRVELEPHSGRLKKRVAVRISKAPT